TGQPERARARGGSAELGCVRWRRRSPPSERPNRRPPRLRRCSQSSPSDRQVVQHGVHGGPEGTSGGGARIPAERPDAICAESHDRHVTLPPTGLVTILDGDTVSLQPEDIQCQSDDFTHGDVVAGGYVVAAK